MTSSLGLWEVTKGLPAVTVISNSGFLKSVRPCTKPKTVMARTVFAFDEFVYVYSY